MRVVIKVGTSTLTHTTGRMNIRHVETLCKVLSDVKNAGHEVVLVSSGAIGMVLTSDKYTASDYIRDYQEFLDFRNHLK